jgi:tRNA (adenine57-N1/adenine58-N1)-methyltransferase catalytic subunit
MTASVHAARNLAAGDKVILLDSKKRRYLIDLTDDGEFHSHAGFVRHGDIVGEAEGCRVRSTKNAEYIVLRPTLEDFVIEMPRGAQVIYPKDLAPICMLADIGPGMRVFESGIGSGALSTTMLRYGAEIVGYEIREDFANRAKANVRGFLGESAQDRYEVHIASSYEGIDPAHGPFDRVVLDLPEPWQVVPHAETVLRAGGILLAYTPSITQAAQTREALKGKWIDARTIEVLHRGWHIEGQAVRPDHRMVAHTGFLSVARFLGKNAVGPVLEPSALVATSAAESSAGESGSESVASVEASIVE